MVRTRSGALPGVRTPPSRGARALRRSGHSFACGTRRAPKTSFSSPPPGASSSPVPRSWERCSPGAELCRTAQARTTRTGGPPPSGQGDAPLRRRGRGAGWNRRRQPARDGQGREGADEPAGRPRWSCRPRTPPPPLASASRLVLVSSRSCRSRNLCDPHLGVVRWRRAPRTTLLGTGGCRRRRGRRRAVAGAATVPRSGRATKAPPQVIAGVVSAMTAGRAVAEGSRPAEVLAGAVTEVRVAAVHARDPGAAPEPITACAHPSTLGPAALSGRGTPRTPVVARDRTLARDRVRHARRGPVHARTHGPESHPSRRAAKAGPPLGGPGGCDRQVDAEVAGPWRSAARARTTPASLPRPDAHGLRGGCPPKTRARRGRHPRWQRRGPGHRPPAPAGHARREPGDRSTCAPGAGAPRRWTRVSHPGPDALCVREADTPAATARCAPASAAVSSFILV